MPDYVYLLENRLSADQRHALRLLRDAALEAEMILFLTGGAVRDLTSGHAVRDLEVTVHGNALKLKKSIEKAGGKVWGEDELSKTLYLCFPGTVRVDVVSAHRVEYPKPAKPVYHAASIQEDLRRRDFTTNAMAISLNEGSFGLLMDPLNGAADIEARTLRLVSNYGFLEEPALLIRASRYRTRLGWEFDPRTQSRYDNAKAEGVIEFLSPHARSEELEQIGHEEDGFKVLAALEADGWMQHLFPAWTASKADAEGLRLLHEQVVELLMQGVHPDMSAAQMQLLTANLSSRDVSALKKLMLRPGFVEEWNSLDSMAAAFAKALLAKDNQTPSKAYKLFKSYDPEAILWLGFTTKDAAIKERYNLFLKVWPEARQRTPHALMQELRITPELPAYPTIVESIFLELIDGRLTTPEEMRAFLEPHSPPAPPPQVTIKRARGRRGAEAKFKEPEEEEEEELEEEELEGMGGEEEEIDLGIPASKGGLEDEMEEEAEPELVAGGEGELETEEDEEEGEAAPVAKRGSRRPEAAKAPKPAPAPASVKAGKPPAAAPAPAKPQALAAAAKAAKAQLPVAQKPVAAKPAAPPPKAAPAPAAKAKPAPPAPPPAKAKPIPAPKLPPAPAKAAKAAAGKPAAKAPAKAAGKPAAKAPAKPVARPAAKPAPAAKPKPAKSAQAAKTKPAKQPAKSAKPAAKKPAPKPAKKR